MTKSEGTKLLLLFGYCSPSEVHEVFSRLAGNWPFKEEHQQPTYRVSDVLNFLTHIVAQDFDAHERLKRSTEHHQQLRTPEAPIEDDPTERVPV